MFPGSLAGCCLKLWGSCDPGGCEVSGEGVRRRDWASAVLTTY
jgi:hypothetical protein